MFWGVWRFAFDLRERGERGGREGLFAIAKGQSLKVSILGSISCGV